MMRLYEAPRVASGSANESLNCENCIVPKPQPLAPNIQVEAKGVFSKQLKSHRRTPRTPLRGEPRLALVGVSPELTALHRLRLGEVEASALRRWARRRQRSALYALRATRAIAGERSLAH